MADTIEKIYCTDGRDNDSLRNQMADNQNSNLLMDAV